MYNPILVSLPFPAISLMNTWAMMPPAMPAAKSAKKMVKAMVMNGPKAVSSEEKSIFTTSQIIKYPI